MIYMMKQFLPKLDLLLNVFNLIVGLGFLTLGGQYILNMFGLIDAPEMDRLVC